MYPAERPANGAQGTSVPWDQRLARILVRPLAATPVTPNQITGLSLLLGLAGAWCFAQGGVSAHYGALLFILATFLDHTDGELARMTGRTSQFGHVFDHLADGVTHVALFCGIGLGLAESELGIWAAPMGLVAGLAVAVTYFLRYEMERRLDHDAITQPSFAGFEIEDILYIVGPLTWLGGLVPFLVLASIGAPIFLAYQVWQFYRFERA